MANLIVFGAGGHAESCREVFNEFGPLCIVYLKRDQICKEQGNYFIAIGDNHIRYEVYQANRDKKYQAFLSRHAFGFPKELGQGSIIMPGAIIREGVSLGDFVIVNSGAVVEHGCQVESFAHAAPGAVLLGNVHIGYGAFVGANATIREGIKIGRWQFVKAGSLVKEDLPDQDMRSRYQD